MFPRFKVGAFFGDLIQQTFQLLADLTKPVRRWMLVSHGDDGMARPSYPTGSQTAPIRVGKIEPTPCPLGLPNPDAAT